MKRERIVNGFFYLCNALTFATAATFTFILLRDLIQPNPGPIYIGGITALFIYLAYSVFIMWKTRPWLHFANTDRWYDLILYWVVGSIVLGFGYLIMLATLGGLGPG